ncbi:MAG: zf-HC2 domain-containing protein [Thermoflavifilum sp.]|nr:zf-HC2 domain-containing protein [Thermoflavifilum sp.]
MDKSLAHIFEHTHCLSPTEMLHYVEGKLSPTERRRVESHLSSCTFCSDAVDGLLHVDDPARFVNNLNQVHRHIHQQLKPRHVLFWRSYRTSLYLVLMIIIVLAILLFTFYLVHFSLLKHLHAHLSIIVHDIWLLYS